MATFAHAVNPSMQTKLPYAWDKAFAPVVLIGRGPNVLVVRADSPYKSVKDVIAAAKANPGKLTYASYGNGTSAHLAGEMFTNLAKVDITHVPYKGAGPAITDVIGGQVDMLFGTAAAVAGFVSNGKLRAIGVTSRREIALTSERSRHRGDGTRLSRGELVRHLCTGRHAAGRRREAQRGDRQGCEDGRISQAAGTRGHRHQRRHTGRARRVCSRRGGAVAKDRQGKQHQAGLTLQEEIMNDLVILEVQAGIATLTLNRPDKRNAMSDDMRTQFIDALESVAADKAIRALVLTGAGKGFCAGGDIAGMERRMQAPTGEIAFNGWHRQQRVHHTQALLHTMPKPTIAAVNGAASGLGCRHGPRVRLHHREPVGELYVVVHQPRHRSGRRRHVLPADGGSDCPRPRS